MNKNIKIYCEGNKDSFDKQILDLILDDIIGTRPLIEPLGGKKGVGSLIQFDSAKLTKPSFYYFFRDRDFDIKIGNNEELIIHDKKDNQQNLIGQFCFSYRTTIENYLFYPKTLYEFLQKEKLLDQNNIKNEEDVEKVMIDAAKDIESYQAVRHTLGALRENLDLGTSFLGKNKGSGDLPDDLNLEYCKNQALKKIEEIKKEIEKWSDFELKLEEFLSVFNQKDFYKDMQFLIWFQGKDFASSLRKKLINFSIANLENYYNFSIKHFDYSKFPDLVQLRTIIQQKLSE